MADNPKRFTAGIRLIMTGLIIILVIVIVGGMGNIPGVLVGAVVLAANEQELSRRMLLGQLDAARQSISQLLDENERLQKELEQVKLELRLERQNKFRPSTLSEETLRAQATDETELLHVAPELLTGKAATERSDLYTAGVLGYQMATGTTPYDAATLPALLGAMFEGPPADPRTLRPDLPASKAETLRRALARDPEARFASAEEMLKAWRA